jgi:phosphoribosylformylglycinamidine synthase
LVASPNTANGARSRLQSALNNSRFSIISIHDIGAGGLSTGLPELVNDAGKGGRFKLRHIPNDDKQMPPLEIWCNESQERYVLAISAENLELFSALCKRVRAPFAVLGEATKEPPLPASFTNSGNPFDKPPAPIS